MGKGVQVQKGITHIERGNHYPAQILIIDIGRVYFRGGGPDDCVIGFARDGGCLKGKYGRADEGELRSEEHTSELQSLMRISYAVFCLKKKTKTKKKQAQ